MKNIKTMALASVMAALCLVVLSLGSVVESMDLSLSVLAGLMVLVVSVEFGIKTAWCVFAVSAVLSLFLPIKTAGVFYLGFFGWYPLIQKGFLRFSRFLAVVLKYALFNGLLLLYFVLAAFVTGTEESYLLYGILAVLANLCFFVYDLLLDRILIWYFLKIRKRLRFK